MTLVAAAVGAALAGLAFATPAGAQTLTIALNADIRSTDPGVNRDDNTDAVVLHMVEGLVAYKEDGTVGPLLAEKVETSADGRTYTFPLRKGIKFHNGDAMTSADVLWSWHRYMDPKTGWRCAGEYDGKTGTKVESVEAPDASTVVFKLNRPDALFLDTMSRTDCTVAVLDKASLKPDGSWDKPVGTGPFMLDEWKKGQYVTLKRFDGYQSPPGDKPDGYTGKKTPLVAEVKFLFITDAQATKAGLLSGSIDAALLLSSDVKELKGNPKITMALEADAVKHTFLFQTRDPVMSNVKLRQAIAASLDIKQLVAGAWDNLGTSNQSAIPPGSAYHDATQNETYAYDPAKAQKLLAEAGYKGQKIVIEANRRSSAPSYPAAIIAQSMMQAVGINAEVQVLDWATQLDHYNSGKYQMSSFSYSSRLDPALSYEQFSGNKDKQPRKVWENPKALDLIAQASSIADPAKRQPIFDELHTMQLADTPLIILFNGVEAWAATTRIKGFSAFEGKPRAWDVSVVK